MQMNNEFESNKIVPRYIQIYERLKSEIVSGDYPFGSRIPSRKTLAAEMDVSVITVKHAYELLCDEGYLEARERSGYYVAFRKEDGFVATTGEDYDAGRRPGAKADSSFAEAKGTSGSAETAFHLSVLSKTMRRVMSDNPDKMLEKTANKGGLEIREAIRRYLARNRNIHVDAEQIVIGSGAEYLYGLLVGIFGKDEVFALESPSYKRIEQVYRMAGVRIEFLPLGSDGIESRALSGTGASILHISPYRSFPSGVTASASKKYEYIRWGSKPGRFIIEDDFESEFSIASKPEETMFALSDRDNVVYMNSFSKTISSALRVGYMVLPRQLEEIFDERLGFYSCTVPTFEQLVIAELINSGDFERHINRVRRQKRRDLMGE